MKKKYGVMIVSILILIISLTLIINKPSYAGETPEINYCPEQIIVTESKDRLELLPEISLPRTLTIKTPNGDTLSNMLLTERREEMFYGKVTKKIDEMYSIFPVFSKDPNENRYYSQLFLWWMTDFYNEKDVNLSKEEKEAITLSEKGKIVAQRIEEMKRYVNISDEETEVPIDKIDMSNITYYVTNDYIETSLITPDCTNDYAFAFSDYIVKTTSPVIVVDENGNEQTEFLRGESFKLRIPISEINNNQISFNAIIQGRTINDSWAFYEYSSTSTTYATAYVVYNMKCGQEEVIESFEPQEISKSTEVGTVNIKVVDAQTKEELSDAEVIIIDSKGNEIYRYRTTSDTLTVTLPIGDYTIRQTVTPPNYEAKTIEQRSSLRKYSTSNCTRYLKNNHNNHYSWNHHYLTRYSHHSIYQEEKKLDKNHKNNLTFLIDKNLITKYHYDRKSRR